MCFNVTNMTYTVMMTEVSARIVNVRNITHTVMMTDVSEVLLLGT